MDCTAKVCLSFFFFSSFAIEPSPTFFHHTGHCCSRYRLWHVRVSDVQWYSVCFSTFFFHPRTHVLTCSFFTSREFGHRIKMISMATFKPEEIEKLKRIGNDNARKIWLAKWTPSDFPEPDPTRHKQIREFMQAKYVAKKWLDPAMKDAIENGKPLPTKAAAAAPAPAAAAPVCTTFLSSNLLSPFVHFFVLCENDSSRRKRSSSRFSATRSPRSLSTASSSGLSASNSAFVTTSNRPSPFPLHDFTPLSHSFLCVLRLPPALTARSTTSDRASPLRLRPHPPRTAPALTTCSLRPWLPPPPPLLHLQLLRPRLPTTFRSSLRLVPQHQPPLQARQQHRWSRSRWSRSWSRSRRRRTTS